MQKQLNYLRSHWKELNKSELARFLDISSGTLGNIINKRKNNKGVPFKLPKRCENKLIEYFEFMKVEL